jgi:signal transduction histidine kinase
VEMVNIYDRKDNVIFYSFDKTLLGKEGRGGIDYLQALKGKSTSRLVRREGYGSLIFGIPKQSELRTYVPLRAEKPLSSLEGPILGVFEIVQDLSGDYKTIARFKQRIMLTSIGVMGILFLILLFIVRRGEGIIQKRAGERLMLREKLNQAERLASLGEMVAAVSHEIRNPLGIISSTAELLKEKLKRTDPEDRLADVIVEEANRLNGIVTDFLDFARPPAPNLMACRVEEILERNLKFLAPEIANRGYRVHRQISPDLPDVQADPGLLYQAFLNVLINAMQAMPKGGEITVKISVENHTLRAVFLDNGPGLPDEVLGKIWDPFFTTKDKGSGLGLPIVKKIVSGLGGSVSLENAETGGARVTISFPLEGGQKA